MKLAGRIFAPKLAPTLLTVLMLFTLISLGVWQLQRAEWKGKLIAEWQQQQKNPPIDELPPVKDTESVNFRHVKLLGRFLHDKSVEISPRTMGNLQGYELITPLKLMDGEVVLVDRGFVARETHDAIDQPIGAVFVEGEIRMVQRPRFMAIANDPANNEWYWVEPSAIAKAHDLGPVREMAVVATGAPLNNHWPRPIELGPPYVNNHMTYAFTWFSLALALIVIYFLSQSRKE
jgi:surfeit locus 1 family protein